VILSTDKKDGVQWADENVVAVASNANSGFTFQGCCQHVDGLHLYVRSGLHRKTRVHQLCLILSFLSHQVIQKAEVRLSNTVSRSGGRTMDANENTSRQSRQSQIATNCGLPDHTNRAAVGELLDQFYAEHNLGKDGGIDAKFARVQIGWFAFYIPNTESRRRALFFHDVHHLATGYQTDLKSEAEIGAWEIASSCRDFWAAWILNYSGFALGLLLSPLRTFRAFVRGRKCLNLYHGIMGREEINNSSIPEIQELLQLNQDRSPPTVLDFLLFALWCMPAVLLPGVSAVVIWKLLCAV